MHPLLDIAFDTRQQSDALQADREWLEAYAAPELEILLAIIALKWTDPDAPVMPVIQGATDAWAQADSDKALEAAAASAVRAPIELPAVALLAALEPAIDALIAEKPASADAVKKCVHKAVHSAPSQAEAAK